MATSKIVKERALITGKFTSASTTFNANTNTQVTIPITVPDGYKLIGIVGYELPTQFFSVFGLWVLSDTSIRVNIRSNRNDNFVGTLDVYALFTQI